MSERLAILVNSVRTWAHIRPLVAGELMLHEYAQPAATHYGVCVAAPGLRIAPGDSFEADGRTWHVLAAFDEARRRLDRHQPPLSTLTNADLAHYRSRLGKFIDMLLVAA